MLFPPDAVMSGGPPPQAVLNQRWLWYILMFLLLVTFALRLLGLDVAGALLTGLMLCFAVSMTRDGMQEMARYSFVYAVLCSLNFLFDALPLITELGGRAQRWQLPGGTTVEDGVTRTTVTVVVRKTSFYDPEMGFVYNVQSLSMLISPLAMALGMYLAVCALNASSQFWNDELGFSLPHDALGVAAGGVANFGATEAGEEGGEGPARGGGEQGTRAGAGYSRFQGTSYKLSG